MQKMVDANFQIRAPKHIVYDIQIRGLKNAEFFVNIHHVSNIHSFQQTQNSCELVVRYVHLNFPEIVSRCFFEVDFYCQRILVCKCMLSSKVHSSSNRCCNCFKGNIHASPIILIVSSVR